MHGVRGARSSPCIPTQAKVHPATLLLHMSLTLPPPPLALPPASFFLPVPHPHWSICAQGYRRTTGRKQNNSSRNKTYHSTSTDRPAGVMEGVHGFVFCLLWFITAWVCFYLWLCFLSINDYCSLVSCLFVFCFSIFPGGHRPLPPASSLPNRNPK